MEVEREVTGAPLEFRCKYCGAELFPRKFDLEEDGVFFAIFDHCYPEKEIVLHDSEAQAIEAFNG